jgi:hypothetical protein
MPKFSLAEMLYWLTVWTVSVSVLTAFVSAPFALFVVTVWYFGTVGLGKALGYVASLTYSVGFLFVICLLAFRLEWPSNGSLSFLSNIFIPAFVCSLLGGGFVWIAAIVADESFQRLVRRRAD